MIERNLAVISNRTRRGNLALRNDLRNSFRLERVLEKNSLTLKRKLVEERDRTLKGLALRSKQGEKDKKGGVGALGLLGGGAIAKRFFGRGRGGGTPKIPKLPTRGGASLSRIGRVGRLGRIGPLAVLGTGLDFAGRKAEGQTNLQAGLGAGGGLAGALAGGKAGAILGTAIGGPVGTLVGGIGGSIIGGLAGGRLTDIFSGADRRRKFEEQRVEISTKKSLFSGALDDLDRVLDKLEETSIFSIIKKQDDGLPEKEFPFALVPRKPFRGKSGARLVGEELARYAAIAGITFLLIPSDPTDVATTAPLAIKLQALVKSTRLFKALKAIFVKPPKVLQPGKDIPGISAKGIRIRAEALLKKLNPKIKFPPPKPKIKKIKTKVKDSDIQDLIRRNKEEISPESPLFKLFKPKTKIINPKVKKGGGKDLNPNKKIGGESNTTENLEIMKNIESQYPNLFSDAGGISGGDIALAPTNNIFLINQDNSQKSSPLQIQGGDTIVIGGNTGNPIDAMHKYAVTTALQTA